VIFLVAVEEGCGAGGAGCGRAAVSGGPRGAGRGAGDGGSAPVRGVPV